MSAKHTPGVLAGIRNDAQRGGTLFRWPAAIEGFGSRRVVPFTRCEDCPRGIHLAIAGTFIRFGTRALCLGCARRRAA